MNELDQRQKYFKIMEKFEFVLTKNQLQIMKLHLYEDLSYGEIAEIMATSRAAIFDTIKKSKIKLDKFENK